MSKKKSEKPKISNLVFNYAEHISNYIFGNF